MASRYDIRRAGQALDQIGGMVSGFRKKQDEGADIERLKELTWKFMQYEDKSPEGIQQFVKAEGLTLEEIRKIAMAAKAFDYYSKQYGTDAEAAKKLENALELYKGKKNIDKDFAEPKLTPEQKNAAALKHSADLQKQKFRLTGELEGPQPTPEEEDTREFDLFKEKEALKKKKVDANDPVQREKFRKEVARHYGASDLSGLDPKLSDKVMEVNDRGLLYWEQGMRRGKAMQKAKKEVESEFKGRKEIERLPAYSRMVWSGTVGDTVKRLVRDGADIDDIVDELKDKKWPQEKIDKVLKAAGIDAPRSTDQKFTKAIKDANVGTSMVKAAQVLVDTFNMTQEQAREWVEANN